MKQSYEKFVEQIKSAGVESVSQSLTYQGFSPIKLEANHLQFSIRDQKLKDSPWIKNKEPFENRQNLYLRIIDLMKAFLRFEEKNFLQFANRQTNISHIINKTQCYRLHSQQFQLLFFLIKMNNRKLISLYIKLRDQILKRCGLNTLKFMPISTHNQNKNFINPNVQLGSIKIDYLYWGILADITKSKIYQDMLWWLSDGNRKLGAVSFVYACIWSHFTNFQNPEQDN